MRLGTLQQKLLLMLQEHGKPYEFTENYRMMRAFMALRHKGLVTLTRTSQSKVTGKVRYTVTLVEPNKQTKR